MRLLPAFTHVPGFPARTWLMVLGLVSLGTASFLLVQVQDVKRLFAFSTVEHMGILFIALGLGPLGDYGAMYHLLTHGITKATAFYAAGTAVLATGTREIGAMRGLVRVSRTAGAGLLLAGLAITGAPPFGVFLSELTILRAAVLRNEWWVLGLVLFFLAIAFAGVMLHVNRMVFGEPSHRPVHTGASLKLALALSAVPVVVLGVYLPQPLQHLFALAAATLGR
jgi:hydrogenase-4 component F